MFLVHDESDEALSETHCSCCQCLIKRFLINMFLWTECAVATLNIFDGDSFIPAK